MKKIFLSMFVLLLALTLVACNKDEKFPKVNEKDKVDLTVEEAKEKIEAITFDDNKISRILYTAKLEMTFDEEKVTTTMDGDYYASEDKMFGKMKSTTKMAGESMTINITQVLEENFYYIKTTMPGMSEKYKIDLNDLSNVDPLIREAIEAELETGYDEDFLGDLINEQLLNSEFEGLTFYEKGNNSAVKLEISHLNSHLVNSQTLTTFEETLDELKDLIPGKTLEYTYLMIIEIKDNAVTKIGFSITMSSASFTMEQEIIMTYVDKMPKHGEDLSSYPIL